MIMLKHAAAMPFTYTSGTDGTSVTTDCCAAATYAPKPYWMRLQPGACYHGRVYTMTNQRLNSSNTRVQMLARKSGSCVHHSVIFWPWGGCLRASQQNTQRVLYPSAISNTRKPAAPLTSQAQLRVSPAIFLFIYTNNIITHLADR